MIPQNKARKIAVVLRFSAMGDVILLLPSLHQVLSENPDLEIIVVSNSAFSSFFTGHSRLHFKGISFRDTYKGFLGTLRLATFILSLRPSRVIDQHQSIRSTICRWYAAIYGIPTAVIRKDKWAKIGATRRFWKTKKNFTPLIERYADTWRRAGLLSAVSLDTNKTFIQPAEYIEQQIPRKNEGEKWIAIAPFSQHKGKNWPIHYFAELMEKILESAPKSTLFLVGGRAEEVLWQDVLPRSSRVHSLASYSFEVQFAYFKQFDVLVCLDSSNLHLANMMQVPTLSIWGATHPSLGYAPFSLVENRIVQDNTLDCRPCSTYGKTRCHRGDFACLYQISPNQVWEELKGMIDLSKTPLYDT